VPSTRLVVVTPVYNEEETVATFHARTRRVLDALEDVDARILFVVDRCTDNTVEVIRGVVAGDPKAGAIVLSSRFGHQMSLLAGIEQSLDADAIVMMDCDLQHPPELIPQLFEKFRDGYEVVYTVRSDTENLGSFRKSAGNLFYRALSAVSEVEIKANAADFRLISGRVANVIASGFRERNMFLRGLISWIGFRQASVEYVAAARAAGESKYNFGRMMKLASAGVLSFSTKPLQIGIFVGVAFAALAFIYTLVIIGTWFVDRSLPSGWTSLVVLLLLFSGVQLIVVGILGAYIGGIYEEVKGRPRYIIDERIAAK
jgi:polyisoprenyl-phosphate glycosyltransferase